MNLITPADLALYGWLIQALLLAALVRPWLQKLPGRGNTTDRHRTRLALTLSLMTGSLAFLPLAPIGDLAAWWHGAFGPPSFTLVQLALLRLLQLPPPAAPGRWPGSLLCLAALGFYATALGLGSIDPYAWGLPTHPLQKLLLLALLLLALRLYLQRQSGWLWILSLDLMAYTLGLYGNLWDALFDPLLVLLLAWAMAPKWLPARLRKKV